MAEEPQLGSIQQRIAALKQAQAAQSGTDPSPFRPVTERSKSANNPPSYNVTGSVLDSAAISNEPTDDQIQTPSALTYTPIRSPDPPPPPARPELPSRPEPPTRPEARPALPPRRPTEPLRRPSQESTLSDASQSTAATSVGRGASTTSLNSNGNSRIKAPAWGDADLPKLPPRRPKEDLTEIEPPRPESKSRMSGLTSKINTLRGKAPSSSSTSSSSTPSRPSLPTRTSGRSDTSLSTPQLPPRRPSGGVEAHTNEANGTDEDFRPSLPIRRLPPPSTDSAINDARQSGFGISNKSPSIPARPSSTPTQNGGPPPIPHGSRPDLSRLNATKPRFHASVPSASPSEQPSTTECLVCRDFSGPDTRAAQYPRATLPSQDLGWLANELTAPFPSLTDKARVIFTWLHHNVQYDVYSFFNNCVKPSTPASTLATGLAVCEGYAALFVALATKAGLEAIVISGHGKGFGYEPLAPGASVPPYNAGHAWNAVKIDGGRWKLIDPCWGAGAVNGHGQPYIQRFEPHMFTISNDEFGLKHFPGNKDHFFRDDGRQISWEEYITTNPDMPSGLPPIKFFGDADKHSIGRKTVSPASGRISLYNTPGPIRFQFGLLCEHWTLAQHSRQKPGLFLLMIHGVDGRKDDRLPFTHVPGSGPSGGGELWYVDVPEARMLGAPGQKLSLAVLTSLGDRKDCRGVTVQEYQSQVGRVGMAWAYVAEWELVR
ncbi:hypothetical protein N7462_005107 [Penicillium macrosclerotiorum]|uniref:uncharacterized protein n=1 Tax=Penicillium macrosclerotiorum TaxID=303699 RepID=UPI0025481085|nr:uncharacterized protein N7462_005107 [Penicillium macrosclerotiorum]KAJ5690715.1 hypothetical protein N7462_005107 [Penicillium macrosclerotiorum]